MKAKATKAKAKTKGRARGKPRKVARREASAAQRLAAELATSPDDLELQRVFADALLDQGGAEAVRGELVQRSLAGNVTEDLLEAFEQSLRGRGITGLRHAGGFVRSWTCSTDDFASFARELFDDEPLLREVVIDLSHRDARLQIGMLAATPELTRVRHLTIVGHKQRTGRPGTKGLATLLASKYWPKLEALRLPNCSIGDAGAKLLAKAASLDELRELDVSHNELLASSVVALAGSPHLAQLTSLDLRGNKPGDRGIKALVESPFITRLERIDTSMTWLAPINVAPLKQRWPDLDHVHNPHVVY